MREPLHPLQRRSSSRQIKNELLLHLDNLRDALGRSLQRQVKSLNDQLVSLHKRVRHPGHALSQQRTTLTNLMTNLQRATERHIGYRKSEVRQLRTRLATQHPRQRLTRHQVQAQQLKQQLQQRIQQRLRDMRSEVTHQQKLLASLGPEQILGRGYAIVTGENGAVIRQTTQAKTGDALRVREVGVGGARDYRNGAPRRLINTSRATVC